MLLKRNFIILMFILVIATVISGCSNTEKEINYREEMRNFVEAIGAYSENFKNGFVVVPQNGHELVTIDGTPDGKPANSYLDSIDGLGREDLFYGYNSDNEATPQTITEEITSFLDIAKGYGKAILVTDYCSDHDKVDDSYSKNFSKGYISFAADSRGLDDIPGYPLQPYNLNSDDINSINDAKNFLYLINPDVKYSTKEDFISALKGTDYDLLIIDLFFGDEQLSLDDVNSLKIKSNGGKRIVISYMSIGEAEDYRYYWKDEWSSNPPDWLVEENPDWEGNYKVRYWMKDWQDIIFGSDDSYLDRIISSGFDGVYLDIIDAYEYFEDNE